MAKIWVADTEPHPRFTVYSRSNVGEVFPNVITVLTGTLIADAVHQAQTEAFLESGALRPHEGGGPSLTSGVFGGYLYLGASAMRLFGVRMPGVSLDDIDEQILGEVADLPPYEPRKGDRNVRATLAMIRFSLRMLGGPDLSSIDEGRSAAQRWLATMPDLTAAPDDELLGWVRTFPDRQKASMKRLAEMALVAGGPRGIIDQVLLRANAPAGLANRMVAGTGEVDSARLGHRLWAIGRLVAADPELTAAFDAGLDDIARRLHGTSVHVEIEAFLADHGHRGSDEYELATLPWAMDPAPVYAAVDRLRRAPAERDPVLAANRLAADAEVALTDATQLVPRPARPILRRATHAARQGAIGRERAKDILVLENLGARRVLHELVRRAAANGGSADPRRAFCVTIDELGDYVANPGVFQEVIAERAELERYLNERIPPDWFDTTIPDPATWTLRSDVRPAAPAHGEQREGIAVSGGIARGPAKVVETPADPRGLEPGEVLVCAITDPSWTPLFLGAAAVVCDTGAIQSHAAIVARELGIPAVMSVPGITAIADGTILHVDGDAGTVGIG